jgi:methionyl-tRNA synthetase
MGQYQDRLIDHIRTHPQFIQPESRRNEVLGFLTTQKLGDLSISRPKSRLSWGIELPFDKDYVTYVWFDALVNYVSALEYLRPTPSRDRYWPASVHLVGKDILTTHAVYWSTMLMALNLPLPETIFAHGWWTVDGEKMSKSRGNVVDPNKMIDEFGADAFRYFLLREVPFGYDGDFSHGAVVGRINSELADDLGNLLSRSLTMVERFANGVIPQSKITSSLSEKAGEVVARAYVHLERLEFGKALEAIWELVQSTNQYIDKTAPWKMAKKPEAKAHLDEVLLHLAAVLKTLGVVLYPFMPSKGEEIFRQIGLAWNPSVFFPAAAINWNDLPGRTIVKGNSLFPRIEPHTQGAKTVSDATTPPQPTAAIPKPTPVAPQTAAPAAPAQITIDEFMKIQLKTAKVLTAERVPKSEKLLKLQVSLGEGAEPRQIVAGIGKKYEPEALIGKTIIIVANLKPAKLMGIESQGMVLAAGDSEVRGLATILEEVDPGTKVK